MMFGGTLLGLPGGGWRLLLPVPGLCLGVCAFFHPLPLPAMPAATPTAPSIEALAFALHSPHRWRLLGELSRGQAMPVAELARRVGILPVQCSKHLIYLKRLGVVVQGWGRLYSLAPAFMPAPGSRDVLFGPCTLHFRD
jgi:hypothetical protein